MNRISLESSSLETERLRLRPLEEADIPEIVGLAGDRDIAEGALTIPHPYSESDAREFFEKARERWSSGEGVTFAIVLRESGELLGCCGIDLIESHRSGEVGYWIGKPYWNRGYASEALRRLIGWAFSTVGLEKIIARVFDGNRASSRVLEKTGMRQEGFMRKHLVKWGERKDVELWGLLAEEWEHEG